MLNRLMVRYSISPDRPRIPLQAKRVNSVGLQNEASIGAIHQRRMNEKLAS